jgi:single-stranded-DNA-specific exonuclease
MAAEAPDAALPRAEFRLEPFAYREARSLMDVLGLSEPVAVTLIRRGYRTVEEARAFLEAAETHDPFEFDSMGEVCERIRAAIAAGLRITVHGDYDVDGVCSTSILVTALRELGADCDWYIPDRLADGYGLTLPGIQALAQRGTKLLVSVDCGIGSTGEVAAARAAGIEVIVTDHHQPGEELPDCPVLHPVVSGYPCQELCATGVAYKLAAALQGEERAERDLDLVALATVADMVPLRGENRSLVRRGLVEARRARRPGMRALMAVAAVDPGRLDEGDLSFRLAPRINAAGRLYRADAAVELMLTGDDARAAAIANELDKANRERRDAELQVLGDAERARSELPPEIAAAPALVLAGEGWHAGVVGIVASRLVERHGVPVVMVGLDGAGSGRGSGRSIPGFDLLEALVACEEHLVRFGGHRAAAGLEIEVNKLPAFREAFAAHASAVLGPDELQRTESIDAVVGGESLGFEVAEQFERLAPFGLGNPGVRLLVPSARLSDVRAMGEGERHARFRLESGSASAQGVAFGVGRTLAKRDGADPLDVALRLELNRWNGTVEPRIVLRDTYDLEPAAQDPGDATDLSLPDREEWWRRFEAERTAPLDRPADAATVAAGRRQVVDRRGGSGIATVAALASTGEPVLVVCADAVRRRALVQHAAPPARFCEGGVALASGRLAERATSELVAGVLAEGCGIVLADWLALEREPSLPEGFEHVVLIDPPPFADLQALTACACAQGSGPGFLHLGWGDPDVDFALLAHRDEWPGRESLAAMFRSLRDAAAIEPGQGVAADRLHALLSGDGGRPASPEVVSRHLRVLEELDLVKWSGPCADSRLRVVSSEATELERSGAFIAYRERYEEGERFLNRRRQAN